ncbi:MAG: hypothetical protein QOF84_5707 [Streptomyces sp.]|jgi:hypothetical protein|nr:hypothetical protein [Streptomyces sp.]
MTNRKVVRGLVVGTALLGFSAVTPAFAEGGFTSYIVGWTSGKTSRTWSDGNLDSVSTTVNFSGCSSDGATGFNDAILKLWKSVTGADSSQGSRTNYCNTVSWGDKAAGSYYFELTDVNSGGVLSVDTVTVKY